VGLSASEPVSGLRDTAPDLGQPALLDLPTEGSGSTGPLPSEPTDRSFANFKVTESEIRAMAAGQVPARIVAYCHELIEWLDEPVAEVLRKRRTRRREA
jgi:hypothetical protein